MKKVLILLSVIFSLIISSCEEKEFDEIQPENEIKIEDEKASGGSGAVILVPDSLL